MWVCMHALTHTHTHKTEAQMHTSNWGPQHSPAPRGGPGGQLRARGALGDWGVLSSLCRNRGCGLRGLVASPHPGPGTGARS